MVVKRPSLAFYLLVCLMGTKICKAQQDRNQIELENGAYNNILIAIHKDVEEDSSIIQNIKDIFTAGSSVLFSATNRRVYFGTITILVPPTWSRNSEYQVAQREAYENANVLVTNQQINHRPFVDNPFKCGRQGRFIHLSKLFLIDQDLRENQFGDSGKVIARQFAKLRWGVFDEDYVPGTDAEPYYQSNAIPDVFEGTRCSSKVLGYLLDDNEMPCQLGPFGDLPDSCRFVPQAIGQTANASLMFASNIHSIDMFCQNDPTKVGYHNYEAPNLQNKKCDYQSVWDLMLKSTDFKYENSPSLPEDTDTSPNFIVVQPAGSLRIVLVLDTSGSMDGERFEKMIRGAKNSIQSIVPNNSYVAIVEFNSTSRVDSYMTELTSVISRKNLMSLLPTSATGNTCIGCGIETAIEVAQYNGMDSRGVYLILLSDGKENEGTPIVDTLDDIESSGVIVHSIALYKADTQLEELAQMTGGTSATCADGGSAQCVISAFVSIIAQSPQSVATSAPIQVQSTTITLAPGFIPTSGTTTTTDIVVDDSLGLDTVMTMTWTVNDIISVTVRGPDGTVIVSTDQRYEADISSKIITVTIKEAEAGVWSIEISNDGNSLLEYISVNVISKPRSEDVYPPVVNSFLGTSIVNYTTAPLLELYAYVHINYVPVIDATVIAEVVSSTTGTVTTISLLDNGLGADLNAGDGIYSAYFLAISSNGRYGVKVDVNGNTATSSDSELRSKRDAGTLTTPVPSLRFQRTTTAGVFQVENYSPDLNFDILAPSKITDITSRERTYDENRNVTLIWSAVGDDLDQGTAAYYEIRFSDNFTQIRTNFTSAAALTDTDLILGNLSQVASSGTLESLTILLPGEDSNATFSFRIRAWDEAGNAGPLSNIVSVSRRSRPPTTMPSSTSDPASTLSPGVALPTWVVISFSCAALLIVIAVSTIFVVICVRRAPKNARGSNNDHTNAAFVFA